MAEDPLGLVYQKRDNTGAANVIPESRESVADYYLKQDAITRKRADKLLDLNEGKTNTKFSTFWDKDKAYAADLRSKYLEAKGQIYASDPLLKNRSSIEAIQQLDQKIQDASHLSNIQDKLYQAKVKDITNHPDLYPDRDAALKKLDETWADVASEKRTLTPTDPATMRADPTDVFKYIKTLTVPTSVTSKPVDIGGGVIKQVETKDFDEKKSEAEAHLMLGDATNSSATDPNKSKYARRLLAMANDFVATNYPSITDDQERSKMAVEWATNHYVEIQRSNYSDFQKTHLQNAPKGDVDPSVKAKATQESKISASWVANPKITDPVYGNSIYKGKLDSGTRKVEAGGKLYFANVNVGVNPVDYTPAKSATDMKGNALDEKELTQKAQPVYYEIEKGRPVALIAVLPGRKDLYSADKDKPDKEIRIPYNDAKGFVEVNYGNFDNLVKKAAETSGVSIKEILGVEEKIVKTGTKTKVVGEKKATVYKVKGKDYSFDKIKKAADQSGMTIDEYITEANK